MKTIIANSRDEKYVVYVLRTNKNIHLNLLGKDGHSLLSVNTIKARKENPTSPRREVLKKPLEDFISKLNILLPNIKPSQLVYDISYYQYKGNVKTCIDAIKSAVSNKAN